MKKTNIGYSWWKIINYCSIVILICCCPGNVVSQFNPQDFIQYSANAGFTNDNVTCITQDRFGFLWIGSVHGLFRFDGLNAESFPEENFPTALHPDMIVSLEWMDSIHLLVSTYHGLHIINVEDFSQRKILIPPGPRGNIHKVNDIRMVHFDEDGQMVVITKTGLYQFNSREELVFRYDDFDPVSGEYVGGFGFFSARLDHDQMVVSGQKGNYLYNTRERTITKIEGDRSPFLIFRILNRLHGIINTPYEIKPGIFLVFNCESDSAIYVNENEKTIQYSRLPLNPIKKEITWRSKIIPWNDSTILITGQVSGILNFHLDLGSGRIRMDTIKQFKLATCHVIFRDRDQRIWLGTNAGLFKQQKRLVNVEFAMIPDSFITLKPKASLVQFTTDRDHVYAAGPWSGGLYIYSKNDLKFEGMCQLKIPGTITKSSTSLAAWTQDTILCGAETGLYWVCTHNRHSGPVRLPDWDVSHNWVADVFVSSHHRVWISTNKEAGCYVCDGSLFNCKWLSFTSTIAQPLTELHHFTEDSEGNIWIVGSGLARYNFHLGTFDYYSEIFPVLEDDSKMIDAIACDHHGGIWFSNGANGLVNFNLDSHDTMTYSTEDGLPDWLIKSIATDAQSVWVSCYTGIGKIDMDTRDIVNVINQREMNGRSITSNKFYMDSEEHMYYFGLGRALMRFNPDDSKAHVMPPRLFIESIAFGNDSLLYFPPQKIYSDWNHRNLTLSFCAVNYNDAEDQYYSYRITNSADSIWVNLGKQRKLFFSSLASGRHDVELKVSDSNHRWDDQLLHFTLMITPPFWKTIWFYILCFIILVLIMYVLFNYQLRQLKKVITIRERISQDLHDEVGATLSGIAMYSYLTKEQMKAGQPEEMEKSLEVIQQSSSEMVTRLNDIIWAVDPQHDSLQKLVQRLEDYALEIASAKGIHVDVNIPKSLSDLKVPMKSRRNIYLICKEAINNAVKYSEATTIGLNVKEFDHSLEFEVTDNGVGFDPVLVKRGNGLDNMQRRADDIEAKFIIDPVSPKGTCVSVRVNSIQ